MFQFHVLVINGYVNALKSVSLKGVRWQAWEFGYHDFLQMIRTKTHNLYIEHIIAFSRQKQRRNWSTDTTMHIIDKWKRFQSKPAWRHWQKSETYREIYEKLLLLYMHTLRLSTILAFLNIYIGIPTFL